MKKILFVIDSIGCGGAERALVSLLKNLNYSHYQVDLLYFNYENEYFKKEIPKEVNIIQSDIGMQIIFSSYKNLKKYLKEIKFFPILFLRLYFGIIGKLNPENYFRRRVKDWQKYKNFIPKLEKIYDAAIGYLELGSSYYVIDKVKAKKYIIWQRTDYLKTGCCPSWDFSYFNRADKICVLSDEMEGNFLQVFSSFKEKIVIFPNIIDIQSIIKKSKEFIDFDTEYRGIKIISVGTLRKVKGYDIAIKACKYLKDKGYNFKWYILGSGEEENNLIKEINKLELNNYFILLGNKRNPYPYIKQSDIFVQCSYREGFSTSVFEAKCLQKSIVITNAPGMKNQINHNVNGLISEVGNAEEIAKNIEILLNSSKKRLEFKEKLSKELENYLDDTKEKLKLFKEIV